MPSRADSFKTKASEHEVRKFEAELAEALPVHAQGTKLATIRTSVTNLLDVLIAQIPPCQERAQAVESLRKVWLDAKHGIARQL